MQVARQVIRKFVPKFMGNRLTISDDDVNVYAKRSVGIPRVVFLILSGEYDKGGNLKKCSELKDSAPEIPEKGITRWKEAHKSVVVGFTRGARLVCSKDARNSVLKASYADDGVYCIEGKFVECSRFRVAALDASNGSFFPMASLFGSVLAECDSFNGCIAVLKASGKE